MGSGEAPDPPTLETSGNSEREARADPATLWKRARRLPGSEYCASPMLSAIEEAAA
jgi:hypothetical protein